MAYHGLMVVGPGLLTSHGLYAVNTHYRLQTSVMSFRTGDGLAGVMHHIAVVFDESLYQRFVCHKHSAVFMTNGEIHRTRLVLEVLEVLSAMGSVDLVAVGVVIDIIPVANFRCRWSFGKRLCEWLGGRTPGTIRRICKSHLDIPHRTGVVFYYHHIVILPAFHECCVDGRKPRVVEKLRF